MSVVFSRVTHGVAAARRAPVIIRGFPSLQVTTGTLERPEHHRPQYFCAHTASKVGLRAERGVEVVEHDALMRMDPSALATLQKAFVGDSAFGVVGIRGIPGYAKARRDMFDAAARLAFGKEVEREWVASSRQTFPGWNGSPGREVHPLQSNFLHNIKEEVGNRRVDPYYGKNAWPDESFKQKFTAVNEAMYAAALQVMRGCDHLVQLELGPQVERRLSNFDIADQGTTLAGRWILYDSAFSRDDQLFSDQDQEHRSAVERRLDELVKLHPVLVFSKSSCPYCVEVKKALKVAGAETPKVVEIDHDTDGPTLHELLLKRTGLGTVPSVFVGADHLGGHDDVKAILPEVLERMIASASEAFISNAIRSSGVAVAGHSEDGLASMRTHKTAIRSTGAANVGHSEDELESMRTHKAGISSTGAAAVGHSEDGLASMRTHKTAIRSVGAAVVGHSEDGLASMRTHKTGIRSTGATAVGHVEDGLASMRTHKTSIRSTGATAVGHVEDGLASMRTHKTSIRSTGATAVGHSEDGLASMRTHKTAIRSTGAAAVGHSEDGLASMRTHKTAIRSTGAAAVGQIEDGLASSRTSVVGLRSICTAVAGGNEDGLVSSFPNKTAMRFAGTATVGHDEDGLASMRTHKTSIRSSGLTTASQGQDATVSPPSEMLADLDEGTYDGSLDRVHSIAPESSMDTGDYWLPWHIDSQFITLLTCDEYYDEATGDRVPQPDCFNDMGLIAMNKKGEVTPLMKQVDRNDDIMMVQMGGFAQIYSGGVLTACRHAVLRQDAEPGIARATYANFWYAPWDLMCTVPEGRSETDAVNQGWNAMMDNTYVGISMRESFQAFRDYFASLPVADELKEHSTPTSSFQQLSKAMQQPPPRARPFNAGSAAIVVDIFTDIRCPFSHVALRRLSLALDQLSDEDSVNLRYHPVFLDPNVPEEGRSLDEYLLQEHGITPEQSRSPEYPLTVMGGEVGITFNPDRRVVNTLRAFCALSIAAREGKACALFRELSDRYFEGAEDINDVAVLRAAMESVGMDATALEKRMLDARADVIAAYSEFQDIVPSVPHVLVRNCEHGEGLDLVGAQSVQAYGDMLRRVLRPARSAIVGVSDLAQPMGMRVLGYGGMEVSLPHADTRSCVSLHSRARRGWFPDAWPYVDSNFHREDETDDAQMYSEPRLVTHIDAAGLAALTEAYRVYFAAARASLGGEPLALLDTCSSWISHYPAELLEGARVVVQGLNAEELRLNAQATERSVLDLNVHSKLPYADNTFDFVTNVASVDYLTRPREFFHEVHRTLRPGGVAIVAFSNRCFASKATAIWLRDICAGPALSTLVEHYMHFGLPAGYQWRHITSIDISPKAPCGKLLGDPMWLVTAMK